MKFDVVIIGAGAAGLMCAIEAGKRGRKTLLLDHAKAVGEKIRISGGGRCNFTNLGTTPKNYISNNPHFCVSALRRYTQHDFIALVEKHKIAYHEKTLGQLFCDESATQIIEMLKSECERAGVEIRLNCAVKRLSKEGDVFKMLTHVGVIEADSVVIATGGPSIPKMGATGWGYEIAKEFGLNVIEPRAGLVPFTLPENKLEQLKELSGVAVEVTAECNKTKFREAMLFTHRGLSGPAILQISSYWKQGDEVAIDLMPENDIVAMLKEKRQNQPKVDFHNVLSQILPKRVAHYLCEEFKLKGKMADLSDQYFTKVAEVVNCWKVKPNGTEGYRTAEVALGGVDTDEISSKTFEAKKVPGLYFIGEVVDVTGWLGGYNFQWAWSSGHACGQFV